MFKKNNNINTNAEHKKNRKINYFKIVWVTGVLAILIYILLIVIRYKVYYEYTVGKIYFYNCNDALCYTNNRNEAGNNTIYSEYNYQDKIPKVTTLTGNYVLINENILYNYITGNIISSKYDEYKILENNIIVKQNKEYGVIDNEGNVLMEPTHSNLSSKDGEYFVIKTENKYTLIKIDNSVIYENYDYIFEYNKVVVLVKDMVLSINDVDGKDLIGKTIGIYDKEKLASAKVDGNIIYIRVYDGDKYYSYGYHLDTKEFVTNQT